MIVVFVALKLAWDARVDAVRAETEQTRQAVERLSRELKEAPKARRGARQGRGARGRLSTSSSAQGKRAEVVEQFEASEQGTAHQDRARRFSPTRSSGRAASFDRAYHQGLDHARVGRWHEAAAGVRRGAPLQGRRVAQPARALQPRRRLPSPGPPARRDPDADPALRGLARQGGHGRRDVLARECLIDIQAWNDAKTRCAVSSDGFRIARTSTRSAPSWPRSVSTTERIVLHHQHLERAPGRGRKSSGALPSSTKVRFPSMESSVAR